jgi:gamma-glutamyltranspeptidase / glutathione hydrolase
VFAIGVARPQSCGIGGGGFAVYRSASGRTRALDFRETAPAAFRRDSLQGPGLHTEFTGHLTVGVPGTVAGMDALLRRYGTIGIDEAIAPAEALARRGFRVPASLSKAMADNARRLRLFPAARARYLLPGDQPYPPGATLRQPELGATLRLIMRNGPRAFYGGPIARAVVRDMRAPRPETRDPGLLTVKDFADYRPKWREPVRSTYRGRRVIGMPPPTSGGIAIAEMLNILSRFDVAAAGPGSPDALHLMAEAQKIAFADRGAYVADPDFVRVNTPSLISTVYAGVRSQEIDGQRAKTYGPGQGPPTRPGESTTHVSVIDRRGAAVSITCTIEQEFGSAVVAPGTGFLLNNELTDFGAPGTANEPAPGKRPRSSMSPTIVVAPDGRPELVIGGAGGARIIMGVLQPIVNRIDFGYDLDVALDAERIDASAGAGGRLEIEQTRVPPATVAELERRGHRLTPLGEYAIRPRINAAGELPPRSRFDETRRFQAAADPRTDNGALAARGGPAD